MATDEKLLEKPLSRVSNSETGHSVEEAAFEAVTLISKQRNRLRNIVQRIDVYPKGNVKRDTRLGDLDVAFRTDRFKLEDLTKDLLCLPGPLPEVDLKKDNVIIELTTTPDDTWLAESLPRKVKCFNAIVDKDVEYATVAADLKYKACASPFYMQDENLVVIFLFNGKDHTLVRKIESIIEKNTPKFKCFVRWAGNKQLNAWPESVRRHQLENELEHEKAEKEHEKQRADGLASEKEHEKSRADRLAAELELLRRQLSSSNLTNK